MLATAIIAFREFLEAFFLVGIFIGMNKKFGLGRMNEILLASSLGIVISLLLPLLVFLFASSIHFFTEKNADILEGYLLIFSGFFLSYVIFSLHEFMKKGKKQILTDAKKKMEQEVFDISLFLTIIFFTAREGFEVALLIATTSLFSMFWINLEGLLFGFIAAAGIGLIASLGYVNLSIKKIFAYTEYFIAVIGAAMVKNGISILLVNYMHIHLEKFLPLPLHFLPNESSIVGHLLQNLFGLQQTMSIVQLAIMGAYMLIIWVLMRITSSPTRISK